MSDKYEMNGITITPTGGGWYELTHPRLAEPVKEQGKENAEAKAAELANGFAADDDGSMTAQGELRVDSALGAAAPTVGLANVESEAMAALRKELETERQARIAAQTETAEMAAKLETKTVQTDGGDVPSPTGAIPAAVPREYHGLMDDARKAELKRLGVEYTDIVLEENENIPPTGLFIGHNGRGYVIKPGEPVTVPNFLLGVLDDAIMASPVTDSTTLKVLGYRNRSRYPYRRV